MSGLRKWGLIANQAARNRSGSVGDAINRVGRYLATDRGRNRASGHLAAFLDETRTHKA